MKCAVYNPSDTPLGFEYNAVTFPLTPNSVNEISSPWPHVSDTVLHQKCIKDLGKYGVMDASEVGERGDLGEVSLQTVIDECEKRHEAYLRETLGKVMTDWQREVDTIEEAGMNAPPEPEKVTKARAMLMEWGIITLVLLALLPSAAGAQTASNREVTSLYDLDSATETFCVQTASPIAGPARITTSGSATTITAVSGTPFASVSKNAELVISGPLGTFVRTVTAVASSTSATVDSAVNLSATGGYSFQYKNTTCGTTATSGWFDVSSWESTVIEIDIPQLVATGGVDIRVQCKSAHPRASPRQRYPALVPPLPGPTYLNFPTATASGVEIVIPDPASQCRVGMKIGSADDGGDLTTNMEQISIHATRRGVQ